MYPKLPMKLDKGLPPQNEGIGVWYRQNLSSLSSFGESAATEDRFPDRLSLKIPCEIHEYRFLGSARIISPKHPVKSALVDQRIQKSAVTEEDATAFVS